MQAKTVQTRIDTQYRDQLDRMLPSVQGAYPGIRVTRADVLRMVLTRGIDELKRDIENGRIR